MKICSDKAWAIASKFSGVLASETRDLAALIDEAYPPTPAPTGDVKNDIKALVDLERAKIRAEVAEQALRTAREALRPCEAWIDRWTFHVGNCTGGNECSCGRTAVLHEARAALTGAGEEGE